MIRPAATPNLALPFTTWVVAVGVLIGCASGMEPLSPPSAPDASPIPSATANASATPRRTGTMVLVGRIITMGEPREAEALLIEDGIVAAVGSREEVLARGGDARVLDISDSVAYPGFIDAHAHWIGDRNYYGVETPAEAMAAAISRGWTSISEQWVDQGKLYELEELAADSALPLRVDAYLALNGVHPGEHYGDWYADREPGPVDDFLRVRGLKIHLDNGSGAIMLWEPAELTGAIGRANVAGWQVSVHAVSHDAQEIALDAFETAIGPSGPNPLHHRIEHALQVTDDQLARIAALDLATVVQLDGAGAEWVLWAESLEDESQRDYQTEDVNWLVRWRDFVDAGLHVAASTDMPWFLVESELTDDIARPQDQIAAGMDGRPRDYPQVPEWALDQRLTAAEGLHAVTLDAAYALGDETRRGHLATGSLGDVTVLSGDVTAATPDEIRAMEVIATIVGGDVVYCSDTEVCGP